MAATEFGTIAVLAEKLSVARHIARVLDVTKGATDICVAMACSLERAT